MDERSKGRREGKGREARRNLGIRKWMREKEVKGRIEKRSWRIERMCNFRWSQASEGSMRSLQGRGVAGRWGVGVRGEAEAADT